jgi:hypothetical protein
MLRAAAHSALGLSRADGANGSLAGAAVFLGLESHLLTFDKAAHASPFKGGRVNENVLAAIVRLNEAKAFLIVVELYGASVHGDSFS